MAVTYNTGVDTAVEAIENSSLSAEVKSAIESTLREVAQGGEITVAQNYQPGDNLPAGVDIAYVNNTAPATVSTPSGVPVVIFETTEGRTIQVDGQNPVILQAGHGDDVINVGDNAVDGSIFISAGAGDDTVNGSAAAERISGGEGDDVIHSGGGNDTIAGGSGNNTLYGGDGDSQFWLTDGSDTVIGGDGFEVAAFGSAIDGDGLVEASRAGYSITWEGPAAVITNADTGEVSRVEGVEYFQWSDSALVVASDAGEGAVARLYEALFDRTGDVSGLKFWFDAYEDGLPLQEIAHYFLETANAEDASKVANLSDDEFITALYHNLQQREPDEAGFKFWTDALAESGDRAEIASYFVLDTDNVDATNKVIHIISDDIA